MNKQVIQPLVSVVMCTYNAERFIAEAISSILSQSYLNFEFIIWDDGSTDSTRSIVESFNNDRIRYFYHENTGLGMALRLACAQVKGKYIARMDSDDISFPERLDKEVRFLETHKDYVLVSSAVYEIDEDGNEIRRTFPCSDDNVLKGILKESVSMIVHPMVMMRTDAYENAGGYLPIRKSQDVLFWSRLAKQGKFYNLALPLGKYRIVSSSLDHSKNPYKPLLTNLLKKMVLDEKVLLSDVELYNTVFVYSKQFIKNDVSRDEGRIDTPRRLDTLLFDLLRMILGNRKASELIIRLKNAYYRWKLAIRV